MFYYIYILQSEKDNNFYTGYTSDLRKRLDDHNNGLVTSTKNRRPFNLVYFEGCLSKKDALHREKYLKTSWGKRYVKTRNKHYLTGLGERVTTEISQNEKPEGMFENKKVAQRGGKVAGNARKNTEKEIGRSIISEENYLPEKSKKSLPSKKN